jgi:hypothetical protein
MQDNLSAVQYIQWSYLHEGLLRLSTFIISQKEKRIISHQGVPRSRSFLVQILARPMSPFDIKAFHLPCAQSEPTHHAANPN